MDVGQQFAPKKEKTRRRIGYTSNEYGITVCNSCAKHEDLKDGNFTPIYNTDYDIGDAEFCTASCGKAIYGRKKDYS
jgi:hypothetical protein